MTRDRDTPDATSVCSVCSDSHRMPATGYMCTHCPEPCRRCATQNGTGPFCKVTPCSCTCHATQRQYAGRRTAEASTPAYEHSAGCLASSSNQWQCPVRGCQMLPDEALPASEAWNAPRRDSVCGVDGCRAKLCKHARERLTELLIERDNALATTDRAALIDLATRGVVRFPGASPRETAASLRSRPEERTGAADGSTYYCLVDKEQVWLCGHAECECTCGEDYMTQAEECTWCVAQEDARMGLHETASPFGRCPHCGNSTWLDGKCTGPCTASVSHDMAEIASMTDAEVEAELRAAGADPTEIGDMGRAIAYLGKVARWKWPGGQQQKELERMLKEVRLDERRRASAPPEAETDLVRVEQNLKSGAYRDRSGDVWSMLRELQAWRRRVAP